MRHPNTCVNEVARIKIFCCSNFSNGEYATWKLVKMVRDDTVLLKISFMFNGEIFMPASADIQQMKHSWYLAISFFLFSSGDFSFVHVFGCYRILKMGGKALDLHFLYVEGTSRGGSQQACFLTFS